MQAATQHYNDTMWRKLNVPHDFVYGARFSTAREWHWFPRLLRLKLPHACDQCHSDHSLTDPSWGGGSGSVGEWC
jgi:hypothetical protein